MRRNREYGSTLSPAAGPEACCQSKTLHAEQRGLQPSPSPNPSPSRVSMSSEAGILGDRHDPQIKTPLQDPTADTRFSLLLA